ncbi:MAG: TadE/TadG family type IV pilus assembly protein [Mesorhizobium sp.]
MYRAGAHWRISFIWKRAMRFFPDRRGVAAVEFALIVPLLFIMYFVTMEASQGFETSKKVGRISAMVGDLVAQQTSVVKADVTAIMQIGNSTIRPYNRSVPDVIVTAINISSDATPKATVAWSWKVINGQYSIDAIKDSPTIVPTTLNIGGTFLIRVETILGYKPIVTWSADDEKRLGLTSAFDSIKMDETLYFSPRRGLMIPCSDC